MSSNDSFVQLHSLMHRITHYSAWSSVLSFFSSTNCILECIPDAPLKFTIIKFLPITHEPVPGKLWHTFLPVDHTWERCGEACTEVNFLSVYVFLPFFFLYALILLNFTEPLQSCIQLFKFPLDVIIRPPLGFAAQS